MCSVWDGLSLAFISQQIHSNFNEIQDLGNVTRWCFPSQSRLLVSPEQEKSRRKAGPHMAVLVLLETPLRSTSLSSCSPHRSHRGTTMTGLQVTSLLCREKGVLPETTPCVSKPRMQNLFEEALTKTPLSRLQNVYNHETHLCVSLGA